MADINDFTIDETTEGLDINSFYEQDDVVANPVASKTSTLNLAANVSMLKGEKNIASTFEQIIANENDAVALNKETNIIIEDARSQLRRDTESFMSEFINDYNVSNEQKQEAINRYVDDNDPIFKVENMVSQRSAERYMPKNKNADEVQFDVISRINEINDMKQYQQNMVASAKAAANIDGFSTAIGISESFIPFNEQIFTAQVLSDLRGDDGLIDTALSYGKSFLFLGSSKEEVSKHIANLPLDKKIEGAQKLIDAINNSDNLSLSNEALLKATYMQDFTNGDYSNTEKYVDNAISLIEAIGLGLTGVLTGTTKATKARKAASAINRIETGGYKTNEELASATIKGGVVSDTNPNSLSQNLKDVNPDEARALSASAQADNTEQVASAAYGSTKQDALLKDMAPEMKTGDAVTYKVNEMDMAEEIAELPDADILDYVKHTTNGKIHIFESEKKSAVANVFNNFKETVGVTGRREMTVSKANDDGTYAFEAVYAANKDTGWSSIDDALDVAEFNFAKYGITRDDITVVRRVGDKFVDTTPEEVANLKVISEQLNKAGERVGVSDDYMIKVNYNYEIDPMDVTKWEDTDVKRAFFSSSRALSEGITSWATKLDNRLIGGASVAIKKSSAIEGRIGQQAKGFVDYMKGVTVSSKDKKAVQEFIEEANLKGLDYSDVELTARGFNDKQKEALRSFRKTADDLYWVNNMDLAKKLRADGWEMYVNKTNKTSLVTKPSTDIKVNDVVLDPDTGEAVKLTNQSIEDFRARGFEFRDLQSPVAVGDGVAATKMIVKGVEEQGLIKRIADTDPVLGYRKGYYPVKYKDQFFIEEIIRGADGAEAYRVARATSSTLKGAELTAKEMSKNGREFIFRQDKNLSASQSLSVEMNTGRSASQKFRGKRLADGDGNIDAQNIADPLDSLMSSISSISKKAAMDDVFQTMKQRYMSQFGKLNDGKFPNSVDEIGAANKGNYSPDQIRDAREVFRYIETLENGYINSLDDGWKAMFNSVADILGKKGIAGERAARAVAQASPTGTLKGTVFSAYIAGNPLRQFALGTHQAMQLTAVHPRYVLSQKLARDMGAVISVLTDAADIKRAAKLAGRTEDEMSGMIQAFKDSGITQSISKNSLVKGAVVDFVNTTSKFKRIAGAPLEGAKKVGFDAGEFNNQLSSFLAHYNEALELGLDVKKASVKDNIIAKAENFTYNMSGADELNYTHNALNVLFQFMQVPHKMATQLLNRGLSRTERAKLFAFNGAMYTLPPAAMVQIFGEYLPEDEEYRNLIVQGLEGYMFNKLMNVAFDDSGENTNIDLSAISGLDPYGLYEFTHSLLTTNFGEAIGNTPVGGLYTGRVADFAKSVARYTGLAEDFESPTTFGMVVKDAASIFSGMSNFFKAQMVLEAGKKLNSYGNQIVDEQSTTVEAIAQAWGFGTMDEVMKYAVASEVYRKSSSYKQDIQERYKVIAKHLNKSDINIESDDYALSMISQANLVYKDDPQALVEFNNLILKDLRAGSDQIIGRIIDLQRMNVDVDEIIGLVNNAPIDEDNKAVLRESIMNVEKAYKDGKQQ